MGIPKSFPPEMLLGLVLLIWGCDRGPEGWTPVLEETSTVFLETETSRLSGYIETALAHLRTDPGQAETALREASTTLNHLQGYYLPLFQARERAYNAYRYLFLGDDTRCVEELGKIQEAFEGMVGAVEGGALLELTSLAEMVADARIAALAEPEEAAPMLESLARRLDLVVLKGSLILE
jgi:hypothetical protein